MSNDINYSFDSFIFSFLLLCVFLRFYVHCFHPRLRKLFLWKLRRVAKLWNNSYYVHLINYNLSLYLFFSFWYYDYFHEDFFRSVHILFFQPPVSSYCEFKSKSKLNLFVVNQNIETNKAEKVINITLSWVHKKSKNQKQFEFEW